MPQANQCQHWCWYYTTNYVKQRTKCTVHCLLHLATHSLLVVASHMKRRIVGLAPLQRAGPSVLLTSCIRIFVRRSAWCKLKSLPQYHNRYVVNKSGLLQGALPNYWTCNVMTWTWLNFAINSNKSPWKLSPWSICTKLSTNSGLWYQEVAHLHWASNECFMTAYMSTFEGRHPWVSLAVPFIPDLHLKLCDIFSEELVSFLWQWMHYCFGIHKWQSAYEDTLPDNCSHCCITPGTSSCCKDLFQHRDK